MRIAMRRHLLATTAAEAQIEHRPVPGMSSDARPPRELRNVYGGDSFRCVYLIAACAATFAMAMMGATGPAAAQNNACVPGTPGNNASVTCMGVVNNQNDPDGFFADANNLRITVNPVSVTETRNGIFLDGNNDIIRILTGASVTGGTTGSGILADSNNNTIRIETGASVTGGVGITANNNNTIINAGTITGTGGTAISFRNENTLTLAPTSVINGVVSGGSANTFQLDGPGNGTFDLSTIGPNQQYRGFTIFNVIGGTWTVSNTFNQTQAWNVNSGGTLAGTGTLRGVNVNDGGTLAPGTIGVPGTSMTIMGNLVFTSGATYQVQVNPTMASM